jgi:hypothetical protein
VARILKTASLSLLTFLFVRAVELLIDLAFAQPLRHSRVRDSVDQKKNLLSSRTARRPVLAVASSDIMGRHDEGRRGQEYATHRD